MAEKGCFEGMFEGGVSTGFEVWRAEIDRGCR
jgi:hypothetical protein